MSKSMQLPADISTLQGAFRATRRPVTVAATFAKTGGIVHTLEGDVRHNEGDAVLTGVAGEQWPVSRERFFAIYDAVAPTRPGDDGTYRKQATSLWSFRVKTETTVQLSGGRGVLHAKPGDVIVQYGPDDQAVVNASIFEQTYSYSLDAQT